MSRPLLERIAANAPLVVGSGAAGLGTALALREAVVLAPNEPGSTLWAQGGIAAAVGAGDTVELHAEDSRRAGAGIADELAVELLAAGGRRLVEMLAALGMRFDRDVDGSLLWRGETGHTRPRILHADGDAIGAELMRVLEDAVAATPGIDRLTGWRAIDVVVAERGAAGVIAADERGNRSLWLAPAVVLATGGVGRLYHYTTNPEGASGDGISMAGRAGARLADLEFVQFHPTALTGPKDPLPMLTDALRDAGAQLVDSWGRPIPVHDSRDELARALGKALEEGAGAYLDARVVPDLDERFPSVHAHAVSLGLDPREDPLPIQPAAHYSIGGIDVDVDGRTSLPGLWAVGECAANGAHGASRLSSNALLEALVFAERAAAAISAEDRSIPPGPYRVAEGALDLPLRAGPALDELRLLMWERVGLVRDEAGLLEAQRQLAELDPVLRRSIAGRSAADLAGAIIISALARTESRGCHFRSDFPQPDPGQAQRRGWQPPAAPTVPVA